MRFTKEEFIKAVNRYKDMSKWIDNLCSELYTKERIDIADSKISDYLYQYFELIEDMCDISKENVFGSDLSYFCFEEEFGENYTDGDVTDAHGNIIPFGTVEDVWNELTKISKNRDIAIKPIQDGKNYKDDIGVCPVCSRVVENTTETFYSYCPECGQKINWDIDDNNDE